MIEQNQNNESLNKNINNISNIDLSKIENDFLFQLNQFKIDIDNKLKEEKKINERILNELNIKFTDIESINKNLTESLATINVKLDNFKELESFKKKAESQLITHEIRINNTMIDLQESKYKYDKIFIDHLSVPGLIGPQARYKTIGDYLQNNLNNISSLNAIKDQMRKDIKETKLRIENINKEILTIVNSAEQRCNIYSDNKCKFIENEYILENKIINDKIMDVRLSNVKEAINLVNKTKEMQEEWNNILNIKKDIEKKLSEHLFIYKNDATIAIDKYNEAKNDFDKVKSKFGDLIDFIKDVRFRDNINVKKRIIDKTINKLNDFDKNCYSDSDDSRIIDLDYDFKKGKILKNDMTSDEEEYEKKKKVRKLFKRIKNKNNNKNTLNDNNLKTISQSSNNNSMQSLFNNKNKIDKEKRKNLNEKLTKKSSATSTDNYYKISYYHENKFDYSDDDNNIKINYKQIKNNINLYNKKLSGRKKNDNINKKFTDIFYSNLKKRCESSKTSSNFMKRKNNVKYKLNEQINNKKNIFSENEEEEYEINYSHSENKRVPLIKIKKNHKSSDAIKKISSNMSRHNLKEKKKNSIQNLKKIIGKIDGNNFSTTNIYNQKKYFINKKEEKNEIPLKNIKVVKEKEKSNSKNSSGESINKINSNENNLLGIQNNDKLLMKQYLRNPTNKNINNRQFNKYNSFNTISPKCYQNNLINDVYNEYNSLELKNQNIIVNNLRPKDYDPYFNFNLIELKIDNKNSPQGLISNNRRFQNKFNLNNSNINNLSKTYLNNFQKEYIDCYASKFTQKKNINFNDVLPLSQRNKIKFLKIGKKNYKDE